MMQELANNKNSTVTTISEPEEEYQLHQLARPVRVIFARFFDIILASLIPLALTLTMKYWDQARTIWAPILVIGITFVLFFLYFILIPYFWDGKTIGKFCFQIKLVTSETKLKLAVIFTRELFITFLPWFVVLLTNLSLNLIFKVSLSDLFRATNKNPIALIIIRTITTIFLWYIGLIFGLVLNPNHQILFDRHFHLFTVKKNPISKKEPKEPKKLITRKTKHIHLQENQQGNISDEILKEIDEL
ncbi:RDD family protein [Spiroplasma citri]|uniref:RDD family protein n=1 Tax=Spiroplasma citri TaxID=2133 RepID=UPI0011BAF387|nr:RDD family protein [Spiroplasma citri]QED24234.1 RDD family protein [Spiroplasma citri]